MLALHLGVEAIKMGWRHIVSYTIEKRVVLSS
jgi:hypothetical protein